jgi:hypothetical protein
VRHVSQTPRHWRSPSPRARIALTNTSGMDSCIWPCFDLLIFLQEPTPQQGSEFVACESSAGHPSGMRKTCQSRHYNMPLELLHWFSSLPLVTTNHTASTASPPPNHPPPHSLSLRAFKLLAVPRSFQSSIPRSLTAQSANEEPVPTLSLLQYRSKIYI